MKNNAKFNNILNECLDRMLKGETLDQCLRSYPENAKELEPLLRTALVAKMASSIQPRAEFKARARHEFQSVLQRMEVEKSQRAPFFRWHWRWQSGWAIAMIAVIMVILAGGGTVAAASNSMPGDTLYPVKLATEQVQMAFTFVDVGKAELNARLADKRVEEIVNAASKGDAKSVQISAQHLSNNLENLSNLASQLSPGAVPSPVAPPGKTTMAPASRKATKGDGTKREKIKQIITDSANKYQAKLNEAMSKAPPQVRPALRQAIAQCTAEHDKAMENLEQAQNDE